MADIGKQYPPDAVTDPTGFLARARLHQSKFRANTLDLPYDTYGNYLTKADGEKGKNFYEGFGIFAAVKEDREYNQSLYSNMLRSEHIPFNFFIPFRQESTFCAQVFSAFLKTSIRAIDKVAIEFAPKPKKDYLNDATSFDAYIEYTDSDEEKGIIGIEVKYTEKEYKLNKGSKQEKDIADKSSRYFSVTEKCHLYKPSAIVELTTDKFRQVWRNQLLGQSILLKDGQPFKHFTSLVLFPKDNAHFVETSKEYMELLVANNNNFLPLTYEDFFEVLGKYCPDQVYRKWIDYLQARYLVTDA